jgi:hypothetical protein
METKMLRIVIGLVLLVGLSACTDQTSASPEIVAANHFVSGDAPSLTVVNMKNVGSDASEHTGLLINGSEQVLYDPAGNFRHPRAPRAGDVHYGVTPTIFQSYKSFHARSDYYLTVQTVPLTLEQADALIARAQQQGPTRQMFCADSVASVLQDVPGFTDVNRTMFPASIQKYFAKYPGVTTTTFYETDEGKN